MLLLLDKDIISDPVILIVLGVFLGILFYFIINIIKIRSSLKSLTAFLKTFKKVDLAYRFKELDDVLMKNNFIASYWLEFKNTLVFGDNIALKNEEGQLYFDNLSQKSSNVQCTVDSVYFFNEETLIHSKMNYKFISTAPTILTGMGPLFTFLNISIAFSKVSFANQESTIASVSNLMSSMKVATFVSVMAVGSAISFIFMERLLYNSFCKKPLQMLQLEINKLFESISPEKYLIELLKESKIQNHAINAAFKSLPSQMKTAFDQSLSANLVPYLDNLIYSINKLQEKTGSGNILNELFKKTD
jgi:hypothetical protein